MKPPPLIAVIAVGWMVGLLCLLAYDNWASLQAEMNTVTYRKKLADEARQ